MLDWEWEQMISFPIETMITSLDENIYRFIAYSIDQKIRNALKVPDDELIYFDNSYAANLFISVKYGRERSGIFPTKPIYINFTPQELFQHFEKISNKYRNIEQIEVQFTIVKKTKTANTFLKELKTGTDFLYLAKKYAINANYIKTANLHVLHGADFKKETNKFEQRKLEERIIIEAARNSLYRPVTFTGQMGTIILQIKKIKFSETPLQFSEYRDEVILDLSKKILEEQYPIDFNDAKKKLDFQVNMENIQDFSPYLLLL